MHFYDSEDQHVYSNSKFFFIIGLNIKNIVEDLLLP